MRRQTRRPLVSKRRRAGFTLLELSIVLTIVTLLLGALTSALQSSQDAYQVMTRSSAADDMLRRTLNRIIDELRFAQRDSLDPFDPVDSRTLTFSGSTGWDGTGSIPGTSRTISFVSGEVLLEGQVIATGVSDLTFTFLDGVITIVLEYDSLVVVSGENRTIARRLVSQLVL